MQSQSIQADMNMHMQLKKLSTNNQQIVPILSLSENPKYKIYRENLENEFLSNDTQTIMSAFKLLSFYAMTEHKLLKRYSNEIYQFFEAGFHIMDVENRHQCFQSYLQYICYYQNVSVTFRNLIPALNESLIFFLENNQTNLNDHYFESAVSYLESYLPSNKKFFQTEYLTFVNGCKAILELEQIPFKQKTYVVNLMFEISYIANSIKKSIFIESILDYIFKAMLSISIDIPYSWTASNEWMRKKYDEDDQLTFNIGETYFFQLIDVFKWQNVKQLFSVRSQEAINLDWRGIYSVLILCSTLIPQLNEDEQKEIIHLCKNYQNDSNPKVRLATLYTYHSFFRFSAQQKIEQDTQFIFNYMIEQLQMEKINKLISNILEFIGEQTQSINVSPQQYNFLVQFIIDQIRKGIPLSIIYSIELLLNLHHQDAKGLQSSYNEIAELLIQLKEQEKGNMNVSCLISRFLRVTKNKEIEQ